MIDYNKEIVSALKTILPTYHEMVLTADSETPCISYQQRNNAETDTGTTIGYSRLSYTVKVWGNDLAELYGYAIQIDSVMRNLGFKRIAGNELYDNNSTMIQLILEYEANAKEIY